MQNLTLVSLSLSHTRKKDVSVSLRMRGFKICGLTVQSSTHSETVANFL